MLLLAVDRLSWPRWRGFELSIRSGNAECTLLAALQLHTACIERPWRSFGYFIECTAAWLAVLIQVSDWKPQYNMQITPQFNFACTLVLQSKKSVLASCQFNGYICRFTLFSRSSKFDQKWLKSFGGRVPQGAYSALQAPLLKMGRTTWAIEGREDRRRRREGGRKRKERKKTGEEEGSVRSVNMQFSKWQIVLASSFLSVYRLLSAKWGHTF